MGAVYARLDDRALERRSRSRQSPSPAKGEQNVDECDFADASVDGGKPKVRQEQHAGARREDCGYVDGARS